MANRYRDIRQINSLEGITYRVNCIYPEIPLSNEDYYIVTTVGDRYDTLALHFYNDIGLWWIIAAANNSEQASLAVETGVQIRIPHDKALALDLYNQVNKSR